MSIPYNIYPRADASFYSLFVFSQANELSKIAVESRRYEKKYITFPSRVKTRENNRAG